MGSVHGGLNWLDRFQGQWGIAKLTISECSSNIEDLCCSVLLVGSDPHNAL